jgi:hypothetical protein
MAPKESSVWEYVDKLVVGNTIGNVKARCKCCGKESTTSAGLWCSHLQKECDGQRDEELLEHAKAAADKHHAAKSKKNAPTRFSAVKQTSLIK